MQPYLKKGNLYKTIRSIKSIEEHGNRALHRPLSVVNQYEFPTKENINLFDKLVSPVFHFSAEIWGQDFGKESLKNYIYLNIGLK